MFGLRFVVDPDSHACTFVPDPYVNVKHDAVLAYSFPKIEGRLLKLFKRLWPNHDDTNSIKVIAVRPVVSLQTGVRREQTKDGSAVLCVDRVDLFSRFELANNNQESTDKIRNVGVEYVFFLHGITDPKTYKERKHAFLNTDYGARFSGLLKHTVLRYVKEHHATRMIAFWTKRRPPGMLDGVNRMSDCPLSFKHTCMQFDALCEQVVQEEIERLAEE